MAWEERIECREEGGAAAGKGAMGQIEGVMGEERGKENANGIGKAIYWRMSDSNLLMHDVTQTDSDMWNL